MTSDPPARHAELVLVDPNGHVIGKLPPMLVGVPWWSEVASVVSAVRERFGLDVTILRLLSTDRYGMAGGNVTYLAEVDGRADADPCDVVLDEQPLRNGYAKPGGPRTDLDWARSVLARHGLALTGAPIQVKTWNLSSLWRLPLGTERAWLKVVPTMFQHEGAFINALGPDAPVPRLFGFERGRLVMRDIPGADLFDATLDQRLAMIAMLVRLQRDWVSRVDELVALGLPDWRAPALGRAIGDVFERTRGELTTPQARAIERFIAGLDTRFAALAECGLPDSFVHGDYHSGNVRGDAHHLTILDWGDAGVGHPLLDYTAFLGRVSTEVQQQLRNVWETAWRAVYPTSDPSRAWDLIAPIGQARKAVIYRKFLDNIEPSERIYHRDDPRDCLRDVAEIVG